MGTPLWYGTMLAAVFSMALAAPALVDTVYPQDFETVSLGSSDRSRVGNERYCGRGFGSALWRHFDLPSAATGLGVTVRTYEGELGFTADYMDTAYARALNLGDLSAGIHLVTFSAYCPVWQGRSDKIYVLDNVTLTGTPIAAVPEPGALLLVSTALVAMGIASRKTRRTRHRSR
jgi:hypothetical protein